MPIYEYRCQGCNHKSSVLWRNFSPPESVECEGCGSEDTTRVISRVALHKSLGSKLSELDPKYDKMIDSAAARNPAADPYHYLDNMPSLDEASE